VVEAVNCAVEIQTELKAENANLAPQRRMDFRIGVNLGDVMVEGAQIYGDGVNVAARLESLAEPGGICISRTVHENIRNKLPLNFEDLGEQAVKNIAEPVCVYRVLMNGAVAAPRATRPTARSHWRGGVLSLAGLAIIIMAIVLVQNLSLKPPRTSASIPPHEKPALPLPSIPSIAVMPFSNLSGDPTQEYFSDGIADQLINNLSRRPGLFVIARNSSFAYKGKATKEQEVGRELGVKYLLEGSVRKAADRLRIEVDLVDANSATEMWTARYDRQLKDIFAVQDEIVGKVVTTLGLLLKLDEMKLSHVGNAQTTENLEAFDDFLRAVEYVWRFTKEDSEKAQQWIEKAIELDPKYAEAYALLGYIGLIAAWNQWSENPQADFERSRELAQKALALDDSNSDALALLCDSDWMLTRFDKAIAEGERAVAINPNYAHGFLALSNALDVSGKPEAALRAVAKAMRLDPANEDYYKFAVGNAYGVLGRYQEAVPVLKQHLAMYPNNLVAHLAIAVSYVELGRDQEARAEAAEVRRISPRYVLPPPESSWNRDVGLNKRWERDLRKGWTEVGIIPDWRMRDGAQVHRHALRRRARLQPPHGRERTPFVQDTHGSGHFGKY
jgi:adenylate cyclase